MSEDDEEPLPDLSAEEIEEISPEEIEEIVPERPIQPISHETAAFWIAVIVVCGFLILLGIPLIPFLQNPASTTIESSAVDVIKTESAVLSGIVGAIVGYYYRTTQEKTK